MRNRDMLVLEAAISLMLGDYDSPEDVAAILEQQAQMLRDYG